MSDTPETNDNDVLVEETSAPEPTTPTTEEPPKKKQAAVGMSSNPILSSDLDEEDFESLVEESGETPLSIPALTVGDYINLMQKRPDIQKDVDKKGTIANQANESYRVVPRNLVHAKSLANEERFYVQEPKFNNTTLSPKKPKLTTKSDTPLTGEKAVLRILSSTGYGGLFTFPLWHSGFWVTLKMPGDARVIELEREILSAKSYLGRALGGSIFSNDQVYLAQTVLRIFKECIFQTSLEDDANLFEKIKMPDLQTIAWGIACTIWPNGYNYTRAVLTEDGFGDKVIRGKIDLTKLLWVDYNALSTPQLELMTKRGSKAISDAQLEEYGKSFKSPTERTVDLGKGLSIVLHIPNLEEHLETGDRWCSSIIETVNSLGAFDNDDERQDTVLKYTKASLLNQYRHYVKEIVYTANDVEEHHSDSDTIVEFLKAYSSFNEVSTKITKGILDFIDDSTISIIATPAIEGEDPSLERFPSLVPLDALYTFFKLAMQRAATIRYRENM